MSFIRVQGGNFPHNALIGGYEADGRPLYVARCQHEGGWHPGKAAPHFNGANFAYGGVEINTQNFELLVVDGRQASTAHWVVPSGNTAGVLQQYAFPAGKEADGRPLWVARAKHEGGLHIGKAGQHLNGCNYSWGGREHNKGVYEVLTFQDHL